MEIMHLLADPHAWIAFATLTLLELVLGIDNIVFISILVDKLPPEKRRMARRLGLFLAMFMRIGLLLTLAWLAGLTKVLFEAFGHGFSGRDLVLAAGGAFLLWKSVKEMNQLLEGDPGETSRSVTHREPTARPQKRDRARVESCGVRKSACPVENLDDLDDARTADGGRPFC